MKLTVGFLTLFLLVTSAGAGTLRDNFDDGNLDGWKLWQHGDQSAQWSVKDGELVCISENLCGRVSFLTIGDDSWRNYSVKTDFKIEKTFALGCGTYWPTVIIASRTAEDAVRGVTVKITGQNNIWNICVCQEAVGGNIQGLPTVGCATVREGEWHTMRILANEDSYEMFIDETKICEHKSDLVEKGIACVGARNCEVHFDNVAITGDEIPNLDLSTAVSPQAKLANTWGKIKRGRRY